MVFRVIPLLAFVLLAATPVQAGEPGEAELERWLESDDPLPPSASTADVNEGELVFLAEPPRRTVHYHQNRLVISAASLRDGWVHLEQCHTNLDQIPLAQILYNKERVRNLVITRSEHIGISRVEGNTVQLEDIGPRARLCVTAWTRALRVRDDGSYLLRNGPFMRRFLDGYYPMRVSLQVDYADTGLHLVDMHPARQPGFEVSNGDGRLAFDAWFEGRLQTEFVFRRDPS
jgi:hypothetical protein